MRNYCSWRWGVMILLHTKLFKPSSWTVCWGATSKHCDYAPSKGKTAPCHVGLRDHGVSQWSKKCQDFKLYGHVLNFANASELWWMWLLGRTHCCSSHPVHRWNDTAIERQRPSPSGVPHGTFLTVVNSIRQNFFPWITNMTFVNLNDKCKSPESPHLS